MGIDGTDDRNAVPTQSTKVSGDSKRWNSVVLPHWLLWLWIGVGIFVVGSMLYGIVNQGM